MVLRASRRNLSQVVAEELLGRMRAGEIKPGDRLPTEQGLMTEFGVGRNTVREALQSLVAMGILDVRPGRGAVVVGINSNSAIAADTVSALLVDQAVLDLFETREVFELHIAAKAAERAAPEDILRLRDAHEAFRRELAAGNLVYQTDIEFHRALAQATQNSVLLKVLDALADLLAFSRRQTERVPGTKEKALHEHGAILAAVEARDSEGAGEAMRVHLTTVREAVLHGLHKPQSHSAVTTRN